MKNSIPRRQALEQLSATLALGMIPLSLSVSSDSSQEVSTIKIKKIRQSVCRWCFNHLSLDELCKVAKDIGIESVELLKPEEWATLQKYGLTCGVALSQPEGFGITKGFNRIENHAVLLPFYEDLIQKAAQAGVPQVICFSGNRSGLDDELGLVNCAKGLRKLMSAAEKHKVTIVMELLNSKIDHADYQCDKTNWGVALCEMIGSDRFKLLYDIYHMQIMEGDVIRTIRTYQNYIAHYHTAGVPGRNEIDESQELNYPAVMRAIAETGFKGLVAQEFVPKQSDKVASLKMAVKICDI
jgi:hydroxypyruvate isomerase